MGNQGQMLTRPPIAYEEQESAAERVQLDCQRGTRNKRQRLWAAEPEPAGGGLADTVAGADGEAS